MGIVSASKKLPTWARRALAAAAVWDVAWKGMALWQAAKRRQPVWFVALLFLNTVGILPITYLMLMRRRDAAAGRAPSDPRSAQDPPAATDV